MNEYWSAQAYNVFADMIFRQVQQNEEFHNARMKQLKGANMEKPTKLEYFFIEWLIIEKTMTSEQYDALTDEQLKALKTEWFSLIGNKL